MTSDDVRNVTFERAMRGYRAEDVDDFLAKTSQAIDDLTNERDAAVVAQGEIQDKMYILAQKVEEYRGQEDTLKTALINAQRMGETVVHEAKQKADSLLRDATGKAELLCQQAETEILNEQFVLEKLQSEVMRFKATVLNLYKQHIESLSALDAPVVRVDDFLKEMDLERVLDEEDTEDDLQDELEYEEEEPEYEEEPEPANLFDNEAEEEDEAATPGMGLFEGVPIDNG